MSGEPTPAKGDALGAETPAVPSAMAESVSAPPLVPDAPAVAAGSGAETAPPAVPAAPNVPAVPAVPTAPAVPAAPAVPVTPAIPATPADAAAPGRRRLVFLAGLGRAARFALMVALFGGGLALGSASFERSRPPAPVAGDPVTAGVEAPPIVKEFITALAGNDADAVRSAVPTDPYKLLASELQRWDFATVISVETLGTLADDPRSSTAIVIIGRTSAGNPVSINLIVHADAGKIVSFR